MVRISTFLASFAAIVTFAVPSLATQGSTEAVKAQPEIIGPGQAVSLQWYFTGKRVMVSGGRFGAGANVTGKSLLVDHPTKTTRYNFDVWYSANVSTPAGAVNKPLHAHYSVVVNVDPQLGSLQSYSDSHGWQISFLRGWKRTNVNTPDEGSDGIVYFQTQDDAVERLAVAVLPVSDMSASDMARKVCSEIPDHYDRPSIAKPIEMPYGDVTADLISFSGNDNTHPGMRTSSIVLTFVRDGKAYVVSARTPQAKFPVRKALLEKMVKSFTFLRKTSITQAAFLG